MIFSTEKRAALLQKYDCRREDARNYLNNYSIPQLENTLQRVNIELEKLEQTDLNTMQSARDITLHHRMILDLQEQCELLDLSAQRIEATFVPEKLSDMDMFRDLSFRICHAFDRAFDRREKTEMLYKKLAKEKRKNEKGACASTDDLTMALENGLDLKNAGPMLSSFAMTLQKIFSCTQPRK